VLREDIYRKNGQVNAYGNIDYQPFPSQSSDVILVETEQQLESLTVLEPCTEGSWGQWFLTLRAMYQNSDQKGKLVLATAFSSVGLIAALAMAAWSLPANAIGFAVACGLAPVPILLLYVWLIIVSKN
jgi:hypothetical protein